MFNKGIRIEDMDMLEKKHEEICMFNKGVRIEDMDMLEKSMGKSVCSTRA